MRSGLLRAYLKGKGLRAPSEAKLVEMLKQLGSKSAAIEHDGVVFRRYQEKLFAEKEKIPSRSSSRGPGTESPALRCPRSAANCASGACAGRESTVL